MRYWKLDIFLCVCDFLMRCRQSFLFSHRLSRYPRFLSNASVPLLWGPSSPKGMFIRGTVLGEAFYSCPGAGEQM